MSRYVVWPDGVNTSDIRESADSLADICGAKSPDGAYFCTLNRGHGKLVGDDEVWHIAHLAKNKKLSAWAELAPPGAAPDRYNTVAGDSQTRPKPNVGKQLFAPINAPAFVHPRTAQHNGEMVKVVKWDGVDEWDLLPDATQEEQDALPHLDDKGELTTIETMFKERNAWPPKETKS